jgi:hypothetical protein
MKLSPGDIRARIEAGFSGDLVYQPVHITADSLPRPVAQMTLHPFIASDIADMEPRSLTRKQSSLHIKGLLHHNPSVPARTHKK